MLDSSWDDMLFFSIHSSDHLSLVVVFTGRLVYHYLDPMKGKSTPHPLFDNILLKRGIKHEELLFTKQIDSNLVYYFIK